MSNKTKAPDLFTVYYMNHSKVYEMRMLLDNTLWKDGSNEEDKATSGNAEINAKGETKVPIFTKFTLEGGGDLGHEKRTKMIDTFEYINTMSRMLADIKRNCLDFNKEERSEGDLVYIDNVRLSLLNVHLRYLRGLFCELVHINAGYAGVPAGAHRPSCKAKGVKCKKEFSWVNKLCTEAGSKLHNFLGYGCWCGVTMVCAVASHEKTSGFPEALHSRWWRRGESNP